MFSNPNRVAYDRRSISAFLQGTTKNYGLSKELSRMPCE